MITTTKKKFYSMVLAMVLMASVMFMDSIDTFAASAVPKQYESIFNAGYYAARYPDLAAVFGNDEAALFNHFVTCGMAEGRQSWRGGSFACVSGFGSNGFHSGFGSFRSSGRKHHHFRQL
ncbi:MAG: hypothetical protein HDR15_00705 [Lachnospiraceae bacterium]|nr:hypothetical protein [Lachnospiraceae bacterium]